MGHQIVNEYSFCPDYPQDGDPASSGRPLARPNLNEHCYVGRPAQHIGQVVGWFNGKENHDVLFGKGFAFCFGIYLYL